jgi:hypothetical protein
MDEKTKTPEVIVEKTSEQADLSLFGLILEADFLFNLSCFYFYYLLFGVGQ